jgi:hypothetical protein
VRRRLRAILWFLFWCAFFSLAFTPIYRIADSLLLAFLLTGFAIMVVGKLWKLWKYRTHPELFDAQASSGQGGTFERWRRWALDEYDEENNS